MRAAAICDGAHFHLLDHLAPLCYYLEIPLITDHPLSYELAKIYYPQITSLLIEENYLSFIADHYDLLITSSRFTAEELGSLLSSLKRKNMKFIFAPHGNSDKGLDIFKNQTHAFIYGAQMRERLQSMPLNLISMGNLRYQFYLEHKPFYDAFYTFKRPSILYAPTWNDEEKLTSFFKMYRPLLETLPSDYHLIIKLHPLLEKYYPSECYYLLGQADIRPNLTVLHEFPPIYPILSQTDFYLGDYSSIGYDFLTFDRPLFFASATPKPSLLHQCGTLFNASFFKQIEMHKDTQSSARKQIYRKVFDSTPSKEVLCKSALHSF